MKATIETVFEGYVFDVYCELEGRTINLSYDGDKTWKSTDTISFKGTLNVFIACTGVNGTKCSVKLSLKGKAKPFHQREFKIESKGFSRLDEEATVPTHKKKPSKRKKSDVPT